MKGDTSVQSLLAEEGERFSDHLELLAVMGRDFAASLDINSTLNKALERITGYMAAEGGALFLLDEAGETLSCHSCVGPIDITGLTLPSDQGIVGRCVQGNRGEIVRDVSKDPSFNKTVDEETGFTTRSILCTPMSVQDTRIGAIELVNKKGGDHLFVDDELHMLQALSSSAALAILNAHMAAELVEQERTKRELELAAEIQRNLLPEPKEDDYPVHGVNVPARKVSGDFYDFFELDDGRIAFCLGDVSGKGMNAALLMAKASSLFRCLGKTVHEPGKLLGILNREVCETASHGMFVTMAAGLFDPKSGKMILSNAGHEPPQLQDRDGTFSHFEADAPPIGISPLLVEDETFPEIVIDLQGGTLYVFTDGVTEGTLEDGSELGIDRLKEILRDGAGLGLTDRLKKVINRIDRGEGALHDDLTILAVEDARALNGEGTEMDGATLLERRFPAEARQLKEVRGLITEAVGTVTEDKDVAADIVLAVDEACQNIIRHAYRDTEGGEIVLTIRHEDGEIVVRLRDFAETVDVDKIKPRDLDELRPGGLGTHFMNEVMDEVEFMPPPANMGNLLRMVKRIG